LKRIGNSITDNDGIQNSNEFLFKNLYTAPLYQQVIDWFREKHNIEIHYPVRKQKDLGIFWGGGFKKFEHDFGASYGSDYTSYYEALNGAIKTVLKLI